MIKLDYTKSQIKLFGDFKQFVQNDHGGGANYKLCNSHKIYNLILNLENQFTLKVGV